MRVVVGADLVDIKGNLRRGGVTGHVTSDSSIGRFFIKIMKCSKLAIQSTNQPI